MASNVGVEDVVGRFWFGDRCSDVGVEVDDCQSGVGTSFSQLIMEVANTRARKVENR